MNIGFDIDDTITNSSEVFVKYAIEYNRMKKINYSIRKNEMDQTLAFGWNDNNKIEFKKLFLEKILMESTPNEDVINVINYLKNNHHTIFLITARSDYEISNIYELTEKWLLKNKIKYDKLFVNSKDKLSICKENNIDIYVDDNFDICNNIFKNSKIDVIIYTTKYNENIKTKFKRVFNWHQILLYIKKVEKEKKVKREIKYIDVEKREDFPPEPKGMRFIHFYGGTKNYRGYLVSENLSRADFMEQYSEYIPIQNAPVYENNGIILRADPKFPCPGFYILSLNKTYKAFDLLDDVTFLRFSFILKKAKEGMRNVLGINYAHLLSNEKSDPYVNVHFWLVPVNGITSPDLLDFDVKAYLNSFIPKENIDKIIIYNNKLKKYFEEIKLVEQDNALSIKLNSETK